MPHVRGSGSGSSEKGLGSEAISGVSMGMTVQELLAASLALHEQSLPVKGRPRNMANLAQAAALRVEALALDPEMTDPAWVQGKASHADLMAFYSVKGVL